MGFPAAPRKNVLTFTSQVCACAMSYETGLISRTRLLSQVRRYVMECDSALLETVRKLVHRGLHSLPPAPPAFPQSRYGAFFAFQSSRPGTHPAVKLAFISAQQQLALARLSG